MACSSMVFVLEDRPKIWTFCNTFRYVFLDLEDCPVEVPPKMTLISLSGGLYGSSKGEFGSAFLKSA